jgi:CRP-like cAMP-binding protein
MAGLSETNDTLHPPRRVPAGGNLQATATRLLSQGRYSFPSGHLDDSNVIIIEKGTLELFYDIAGRKILSSFHGTGDICGGIAILKHRGAAIRTIMATSDVSCFLLSREHFLKICGQSHRFKEYFERIYKKLIRDESYVSIISASQAFQFISDIPPFSFLPPEVVENLAPGFQWCNIPKTRFCSPRGPQLWTAFTSCKRGRWNDISRRKMPKPFAGS